MTCFTCFEGVCSFGSSPNMYVTFWCRQYYPRVGHGLKTQPGSMVGCWLGIRPRNIVGNPDLKTNIRRYQEVKRYRSLVGGGLFIGRQILAVLIWKCQLRENRSISFNLKSLPWYHDLFKWSVASTGKPKNRSDWSILFTCCEACAMGVTEHRTIIPAWFLP